MPELGMPTLIETETIEECAALCEELDLDFVELNMNFPQYQLEEIDPAYFQEVAKKHGIFYTIHLDENFNVSDFNPYITAAYLRTAKETIELAKKLSAPVINMHLARGIYLTLPGKRVFLFAEYRERYLKSILEFRKLCEDAVGDSDLMICVENCDEFLDFQKEALELLLASPVFGLTFDIGHDHCCGHLNEPYLLENRQRLHHIHFHDACGKKNHLALGSGEIDLEKYLVLAEKQCCRVVLETKTIQALKSSVSWLKDHGFH